VVLCVACEQKDRKKQEMKYGDRALDKNATSSRQTDKTGRLLLLQFLLHVTTVYGDRGLFRACYIGTTKTFVKPKGLPVSDTITFYKIIFG
jgi:hypothetical protein